MTNREQFEAWYCADAKAQGVPLPEGIAGLREGDGYGSNRAMLNGKWQGWQAGRKLAFEEAARLSECYDLGTPEGHNIARHVRALIDSGEPS